jgi:bifunctional non-homologous end joining protein LigD
VGALVVAMGPDGRPNFNLLQSFRSAESHITYYVFDILVHKNRDLTQLPLSRQTMGRICAKEPSLCGLEENCRIAGAAIP